MMTNLAGYHTFYQMQMLEPPSDRNTGGRVYYNNFALTRKKEKKMNWLQKRLREWLGVVEAPDPPRTREIHYCLQCEHGVALTSIPIRVPADYSNVKIAHPVEIVVAGIHYHYTAEQFLTPYITYTSTTCVHSKPHGKKGGKRGRKK